MGIERTKSAPFAIMAPSPSRPLTLLNTTAFYSSELVPTTGNYWKAKQNMTNLSLQPQAEDNIGTNRSLVLQRPNRPGATQQQTSTPF